MSWLSSLPLRYGSHVEPLRTERRFELVSLVLLCIWLLILVLGVVRLVLLPEPDPVMPNVEAIDADGGSLVAALSADDTGTILTRPLFWSGRKPDAPVAVVEKPAGQTSSAQPLKGVTLLGVFGGGNSGGAIVAVEGGKQRVAVGEKVKGWTLDSVAPDRVSLRDGPRKTELVLREGAASSTQKNDEPERRLR